MNSGCPWPFPFPGVPHAFHTPYCRGTGGGEDCPGIPGGGLRSVGLGSPASVLAVLRLPLVPPTVWGSGHPPPSHSRSCRTRPQGRLRCLPLPASCRWPSASQWRCSHSLQLRRFRKRAAAGRMLVTRLAAGGIDPSFLKDDPGLGGALA